MTGYFDKSFGNWLPYEPDDWGYDEIGNDLYVGDEVYYLSGTDEIFLECSDCLDYWVEQLGEEIAEVKGIEIDEEGNWRDELRDILGEEVYRMSVGDEW